jgi:hypothetical protein
MTHRRGTPVPFIAEARLRELLGRRPFALEDWLALTAPDCHVRIGNDPPRLGRASGLRSLEAFLDRTTCVGGSFWDAAVQRNTLYVETDAQSAEPRLGPMSIPCVFIIRPADAAIKDLRVYLDPAPLLAARLGQA